MPNARPKWLVHNAMAQTHNKQCRKYDIIQFCTMVGSKQLGWWFQRVGAISPVCRRLQALHAHWAEPFCVRKGAPRRADKACNEVEYHLIVLFAPSNHPPRQIIRSNVRVVNHLAFQHRDGQQPLNPMASSSDTNARRRSVEPRPRQFRTASVSAVLPVSSATVPSLSSHPYQCP
jgi:hypothetical protein